MWWEQMWRTIGWFTLVWFASAGVGVIVLQFFLPRAWEAIRAHPPHGPDWARTLWYDRRRVYGGVMAASLALGGVAALLSLL